MMLIFFLSQDIFPLSVEVTGPREVRKGMPWKVATRSSLTKNSSAIFPNTFGTHRKQVKFIHLKIVRASRDCRSSMNKIPYNAGRHTYIHAFKDERIKTIQSICKSVKYLSSSICCNVLSVDLGCFVSGFYYLRLTTFESYQFSNCGTLRR